MTRLAVVVLLAFAGHAASQCEFQALEAADGQVADNYATAVSLWDDRALVTSVFDNGISFDSGSAYVFERQGGTWVQVAKLIASDEAEDDRFGQSGAIRGDTAIVGSRYNQDLGYGTGSAYIFERQGGTWTETVYLVPDVQHGNSLFGQSCDLGDGIAVVGAPVETGPVAVNQGAVYVFEEQGGTWIQAQRLDASDASQNAKFGESVALDGTTLVVGAREDGQMAPQAGAAYVFESIGGIWSQTGKLTAGDPEDAAIFGTRVAIHGDVIAVGAPLEDSVGTDAGAVYVFERDGSAWNQTAKLLPDAGSGATFGFVDVWDDTILVGAPGDGEKGSQAGAVYRFEKMAGIWQETGRFTAGDTDASDKFGLAVSLRGTEALIGAPGAENGSGVISGTAYVFDHLDAILPYGAGCPGTGGLVPKLTLEGCSAPGGHVDMEVADGAPGALSVMVFGLGQASLPALGCTLLASPLLPLQLMLPLDGAGAVRVGGDMPGSGPSLTLFLQVFVVDAGGPAGYSSTAGVALSIGN